MWSNTEPREDTIHLARAIKVFCGDKKTKIKKKSDGKHNIVSASNTAITLHFDKNFKFMAGPPLDPGLSPSFREGGLP